MSSDPSKHSRAERITLGISIIILAGVVGLATWASFATGDSNPEIEIEVNVEDTRETNSGYYVPITITNNGGLTGQNVIVTGELETDEKEPETAEVTIDFLAGGESEQAELVFESDPNEGELTVRPTSYLQP